MKKRPLISKELAEYPSDTLLDRQAPAALAENVSQVWVAGTMTERGE